MSIQLILSDYSKYSFVVFGDGTKNHKEAFKNFGGRWNPNLLLNGTYIKGWIFSFNMKDQVQAYLTGSKEHQKLPFGKVFEEIISDKCDKSTQTEPKPEPEDVESTLRKEIQELNNKLNELSVGLKYQEAQLNTYISLFQMHKLDTLDDVIGELTRRTGKL